LVQKRQTFSFEIESTSDIFNNCCSWV
jgi:hypothetical protein